MRLVWLNSVSSCLSEKNFISPSHIIKFSLLRYKTLGWCFFSSRILKTGLQSIFPYSGSAKKSIVSLTGLPLYISGPFLWWFWFFFSLMLTSWSGLFFFFSSWLSLRFFSLVLTLKPLVTTCLGDVIPYSLS